MTTLNLSYQDLTELPQLPQSLQILCCDNNNLTELPQLPQSLKLLYCSYNNLSELPQLPGGCRPPFDLCLRQRRRLREEQSFIFLSRYC